MPKHDDFKKIYARFIKQYGEKKGSDLYYAWLKKKGYDDTKPLPGKNERKEFPCPVHGVEIKEDEQAYYVSGLIATDHIDLLDTQEGIEIPDVIPKETLDSWAHQINTLERAQRMGVHHSEGRAINPEYYGVADVEAGAKVVELNDGHFGLYVDTKLLKHDAKTPEIIQQFEAGDLDSFSVTYDTNGFLTTDFGWIDNKFVRFLGPETQLWGYTAASDPVNPEAKAMGYGYKEFKELVGKGDKKQTEVNTMGEEETKEETPKTEEAPKEEPKEQPKEESKPSQDLPKEEGKEEATAEEKEHKKVDPQLEEKELDKTAQKVAEKVVESMEKKEKVLRESTQEKAQPVDIEVKEFNEILVPNCNLDIKEQARRAAAYADKIKLNWKEATTSRVEDREYKSFSTDGRMLEFKGLGITTNQNSDTDYLQSAAELQDAYDPVIYNALNQNTLTWNILPKEDFSKKGNNMVQFTLKTAANASATFYSGNAVSTGNVTRLKYQTKFKKVQVGVSVDGDMIAAARGGPVSDVFAKEVADSAEDMLAVVNAALFAEKGAETDAECLGFEYITDSAGNTTLYSLTRSTTNLLSPASAGDTYINQSSAVISEANLRKAKRQAIEEGAKKRNLVWITSPVQGDMFRGKYSDSRRMLKATDTDFGFSTDITFDGIPIFEDKDCNDDDWFLVDLETHRVAIWVPPTLERLGKTADSESAFIKMYMATYNRAPRRMVQIYGCATS